MQTHRSITRSFAIVCALLAGCASEPVEDLDPTARLGGEELGDDGPPADDTAAVDQAAGDLTLSIQSAPRFQLPFPCGQVWAGQSRTGHSPQNSLDFNRSDDLGDAVVAAAAGTVTRVENLGSQSYGRWIELDHGGGYRTRYAHLSAQSVARGQRVSQGQRIGLLGNTGGSTGPHLHYEQRLNGVAVRASFDGRGALYFGTRNYTSQNGCGGSSGGGGSGGGVVARVNTAGAALTVRAGTSTSTAATGSLADGARISIRCQKRGQSVTGTYGTSTLWDHIGTGYVADAFISTGSDGQVAPTCP